MICGWGGTGEDQDGLYYPLGRAAKVALGVASGMPA